MRSSHVLTNFATRRTVRALVLVAATLAPRAFAQAPAAAPAAPAPAASAQKVDGSTELVTFTNKMVDGKKTWTPAEVKVKSGHHVAITLKNELPEPHGFQIAGLVEPVVVGPKESKTVLAVPTKPGTYKVTCQLHPAHVGATFIVE